MSLTFLWVLLLGEVILTFFMFIEKVCCFKSCYLRKSHLQQPDRSYIQVWCYIPDLFESVNTLEMYAVLQRFKQG